MQSSEFKMLVVLAQEMNMRKAAERLYVSQPALSQRLQSIEKSWGTKIFIRSQKGLTLTPAGEKIIEFAYDIVDREEMVKEEISSLEEGVFGTLKLAVASIIGQYWLPKVLKQFVERYPHVKISLVTGWSSEMLRHMYEEHVHIGIIRGDPDWRGRKMHILADNHYLVDTDISSLDDLITSNKPYIQFKSDSTYFQEIQDWWHTHFKFTPKRRIVVDQIETCKQMAINGIGYAILPSTTLTDVQNVYKIPLLDKENKKLTRDTWLIGYEPVFELKQVRAFIEVLEENIKLT